MYRNAILFWLLCLSAVSGMRAQQQPRLIVGIVVDQMRQDYLSRYYNQFGEGGFKRLMTQGMQFAYAHYNYIPTYTGPGHSSIYTGTTPYYHGIISNEWYDKQLRSERYCAQDDTARTAGADNAAGRMSPRNLLAPTIGDELRMSNNGCSRVFGVSVKDRGAILPGGRSANAAYWYDGATGRFISSSYYFPSLQLPAWVVEFNARKRPEALMSGGWDRSPGIDFRNAMPDEGLGESDAFREGKTTFPHSFQHLTEAQRRDLVRVTPFGNELLADFALELLRQERLGQNGVPDLLAISFSSTDYVGHAYGPNSMEVMDTYIRLDRQIARILTALDQAVGKGQYLLFLSSDHGVKPNEAYLRANRIFEGTLSSRAVEDTLRKFCAWRFGEAGLIDTVWDNHIYLSHRTIDRLRLDAALVDRELVRCLRNAFPAMSAIYTKADLNGRTPLRSMSALTLNGFHPYRSGDICYELAFNHMSYQMQNGTSHGSPYPYDTHVPMLFYGWRVNPGRSDELVYIVDIAPTIANLLGLQAPGATIGVPLIGPGK